MLSTRPLRPDDGPTIERLFGPNGACGGCWCMYWHVQGSKAWEAAKGEANRQALLARISAGETEGVLAFDGDTPVGWAAVGPRASYARIVGHPNLQREGGEGAWSVPCFYVPAKQRGKGVAAVLLRAAVAHAFSRGATEVEGYPVRPKQAQMPGAFAWTGVVSMFEAAGFQRLERGGGREIWVALP